MVFYIYRVKEIYGIHYVLRGMCEITGVIANYAKMYTLRKECDKRETNLAVKFFNNKWGFY